MLIQQEDYFPDRPPRQWEQAINEFMASGWKYASFDARGLTQNVIIIMRTHIRNYALPIRVRRHEDRIYFERTDA